MADQSATADAWVIKEKLRWIQKAPTPRAARWRITNYLKVMQAAVSEKSLLKPMGKALATLERHADAVVRRWLSGLTNARLEGMNGLFQAARSRARGYKDSTGKPVLNDIETQSANDKADEIRERFSEWVWEDPDRAVELAERYNRQFNSLVARDYTEVAATTQPARTGQ